MAATKSDLNIVSRVPSKVWEQIFQHVSVLQLLEFRLICRGWRSIVDGCPALMKRIRLRFPEGFVLDREYKPEYLVPARNLSLEKIRISAVDSWWSAFGERLLEVNVDDCEISLRTLLEILKSMKRLKTLRLNNLRMLKNSRSKANFKLNEMERFLMNGDVDIMDVLVPIFPRLRWISMPKYIEEEVFIELVHMLNNSLEGITFDYTPALWKEILPLKKLTHLEIRSGAISDQEMTAISKELPNLKCVDIIIVEENITFLNAMHNLEDVSLCSVFCNLKVDFGESRNPKLKRFAMQNLNPSGTKLHKYLDNSPNVINIVVHSCKFDSWFVLFATLELYYRTLQRLELWSVDVVNAEDRLSEYFDSLKYLNIRYCPMSEKLLIKFISLCPRLEEIHLESMSNSDGVILVLSQKLKHLEKMTLIGCQYLTDKSADYIEENCHTLKQLNIRNCPKLGDAAINKLKKFVKCLIE